jgi:hypothetical protein
MACIFLLGLLSWPLLSQGGEIEKTEIKLVASTVESVFSVIDGQVVPQKSDQETCDTDNAFMLSAFQVQGIFLQNYNYKVIVRKEIYSKIPETAKEDFVTFRYESEFIDFDHVRKKSFSMLSNDKLMTTHIEVSKAPTTCYAYLSDFSLELVCHSGLKEENDMTANFESLLLKSLHNAETPKL